MVGAAFVDAWLAGFSIADDGHMGFLPRLAVGVPLFGLVLALPAVLAGAILYGLIRRFDSRS